MRSNVRLSVMIGINAPKLPRVPASRKFYLLYRKLLVVFWSEHVYDGPSFTCVIYSWLAVTKEQCGCSFN